MFFDEAANARQDNMMAAMERTEEVQKAGRYVVAVYEQDQAFGGPEEGGWWYDTGVLIGVVKVMRSQEKAYEMARRMNSLFAFRRRLYRVRDKSSAAYDGGHYAAEVHETTAPESYPTHRPFYE